MNVIGYTNVIAIDNKWINPYHLKYKEIFFRSEKDIIIFSKKRSSR